MTCSHDELRDPLEASETNRKARAVATTILGEIRTGTYRVGKPLPSERTLASEIGVSRMTLRQAIDMLAQEGWLELRANRQPLVKMPSSEPSTLPLQKSQVALWIWPAFEGFDAVQLSKGVQRALDGENIKLWMPSAFESDLLKVAKREREFLEQVESDQETVGVIAWCVRGGFNLDAVQRLRSRKPFIAIDRFPGEGYDGDFVGTDNFGASLHIVEKLVEAGHRRIAYFSNIEGVSSVFEREAGFHFGLKIAGIEPNPDWFTRLPIRDDGTLDAAIEAALNDLFTRREAPTAIVCVNDYSAALVHRALTAKGLRVPDDISLVGFDGLFRWVPGGAGLSTVHQSFDRIGEAAGRLLLERLTTGKTHPARQLLFEAPWRDNGSVLSPRRTSINEEIK